MNKTRKMNACDFYLIYYYPFPYIGVFFLFFKYTAIRLKLVWSTSIYVLFTQLVCTTKSLSILFSFYLITILFIIRTGHCTLRPWPCASTILPYPFHIHTIPFIDANTHVLHFKKFLIQLS